MHDFIEVTILCPCHGDDTVVLYHPGEEAVTNAPPEDCYPGAPAAVEPCEDTCECHDYLSQFHQHTPIAGREKRFQSRPAEEVYWEEVLELAEERLEVIDG